VEVGEGGRLSIPRPRGDKLPFTCWIQILSTPGTRIQVYSFISGTRIQVYPPLAPGYRYIQSALAPGYRYIHPWHQDTGIFIQLRHQDTVISTPGNIGTQVY
jgi:hypothetical protein